MLKQLFTNSTTDTKARLESYLSDLGYYYDQNYNNKLRTDIIGEAIKEGIEILCEGQVYANQLVYAEKYKYRYIADRAIVNLSNPILGVQESDTIQFVRDNYNPEFFMFPDDGFPSRFVRQEMSVAEFLSSQKSPSFMDRVSLVAAKAKNTIERGLG